VRQKLFGNGDPIGASIRLKQIACRVIGILEIKGASSFGTDQDDIILIPIRTFQRRISGNQDVSMIYASIRTGVSTEKGKADIEGLMRERRRIGPFEEDDFNVFDMKQITSMLTGITSVLTGLLSAVAAVSLLVGGIGIMNIMLVSVTERTREIGIRLAVGATEGQVLLQFLVEAIVLSLIGGLIGILLGLVLGLLGSRLAVDSLRAGRDHRARSLPVLCAGRHRVRLFSGAPGRPDGSDRGAAATNRCPETWKSQALSITYAFFSQRRSGVCCQ
jgi:putative ABC transport system permease protein